MNPSPLDIGAAINQAARLTREADALLIAAGAGMGVDSGLPDFRGTEGFWRAYPAIAKLGLRFEQMANPRWFQESPELAWAFYGHRLALYRKTMPHAGFQRLLAASGKQRLGYFVFTSNVDGQFQKAGFDPGRIVECHGSVHYFQCCRPCRGIIWDAATESVTVDESNFLAIAPLPQCRHCRKTARPNILMFGDDAWISDRSHEQQRRLQSWLQSVRSNRGKLVVIELGAGTAVPSVRNLSGWMVNDYQATLIRINPREPEVPSGQIGLPLGAEDGLRRIFESI